MQARVVQGVERRAEWQHPDSAQYVCSLCLASRLESSLILILHTNSSSTVIERGCGGLRMPRKQRILPLRTLGRRRGHKHTEQKCTLMCLHGYGGSDKVVCSQAFFVPCCSPNKAHNGPLRILKTVLINQIKQ